VDEENHRLLSLMILYLDTQTINEKSKVKNGSNRNDIIIIIIIIIIVQSMLAILCEIDKSTIKTGDGLLVASLRLLPPYLSH
jgi:hypothetical protein